MGRESLARGFAWVQSPPVPELPDLDVVADAFHAALTGRRSEGRRTQMPLTVRGTPAELDALVGQTITRIHRLGKMLDVDLDRDRVVVNPMLTGRLQLARPRREAAVGNGGRARRSARGRAGRRADAASWTAGRRWLPGDDARGDRPVPRPDPDGQGLPAAGRRRPGVPGLGPGEMGPDALDPALTLEVWRERIRGTRAS